MQENSSQIKTSFIVIGRNEARFIDLCISSIEKTIDANRSQLGRCEIIFVDSNSTDNTVEIVRSHSNVSIIQLSGKTNAAIGRNTGASIARGRFLFFVDGDMELNPGFIPLVFGSDNKPVHPFISGQFVNYYYDNKWNYLRNEPYIRGLDHDRFEYSTGGLFMLEKKLWDEVGGMRTLFKTGEDLDLGLRLSKRDVLLLRKKEVMANHHTIHYHSFRRMWRELPDKTYSRGVLYRHHLLNKYMYKRLLKSEPTTLILVLAAMLALVLKLPALLIIYLAACILVIVLFVKPGGLAGTINRIFYQYVRDLLAIGTFLFFYPSQAKDVKLKLPVNP